jgi:hypothetical protein
MNRSIVAMSVALAFTLSGCAAASDTTTPYVQNGTAVADDTEAVTPADTETEAPAAPEYTVAQEQAILSAQGYLDMGGTSRAGLIEQLSSKYGEGFKKADAKFAVNHIKVDWNKQAVQSAKGYLDMGGFSRASLIEQLSSNSGEKFTLAQAKYAVRHVGL